MISLPILPATDVHYNCARCTALCCQYVSTEIDPPTTRADFDNIRWYVMHPGVRVYLDDDDCWFLQFMSRCQNLGADNRCQIYETRPQICRDLKPTECEFALGPGDRHYFTRIEEVEQWLDERARRQRARRQRARAARRRR